VDQHGQLVRARELELRGEVLVLGGRLVVVADLAHGEDAVLLEITRQERDDAVGDVGVVGLLRVSASVQ